MTYLYPRLLPKETERIFASIQGRLPTALERCASVSSTQAIYAASGGGRVSQDHLRYLSEEMWKIAELCGYPSLHPPREVVAFDRSICRLLHARADMAPGEASQRQVWAFLSLVLVPHICAWRFPGDRSGHYQRDRFKADDLTRHTLARCWWRAEVLQDASADDRYHLLDAIGEAELDQLMARRRSLGASPVLARELVRVYAASAGLRRRQIFRDVLKRLLRLTAFVDVDFLDQRQVADLVDEQWTLSTRAIEGVAD